MPPIPVSLVVTKSGAGKGVVTSQDSAISCGTSCAHLYARGTVVVLTAAALIRSRTP